MGFLDTFQSPPMVHALAVHGPISLAFLGIPLVVLSAILKEKGTSIRWLAIAAYAGLTIAAFITVQTGEHARAALPNEAGLIEESVWNLVHDHEEMAEKLWIFALVTTVLTAFTFVQGTRARAAAGVLAVLAAIATAGWIALTGHYGGQLVYVHGLGTPALEFKQRLMEKGDTGAAATPSPPVPAPAPGPAAPPPEPASTELAPAPPEPETVVTESDPVVVEAPVRDISYASEVVPILQEKCYGCHGKSGGLNLQTIDAMLVGGKKAGPAVLAGQPDKSPLIQYLTGELQPRMPQGGDPLPQEQIAVLRDWIAQGMKDDTPE